MRKRIKGKLVNQAEAIKCLITRYLLQTHLFSHIIFSNFSCNHSGFRLFPVAAAQFSHFRFSSHLIGPLRLAYTHFSRNTNSNSCPITIKSIKQNGTFRSIGWQLHRYFWFLEQQVLQFRWRYVYQAVSISALTEMCIKIELICIHKNYYFPILTASTCQAYDSLLTALWVQHMVIYWMDFIDACATGLLYST